MFTPPKTPTEEEFYSFDYARLLGPGETISGSVWTVSVLEGTDASPSSMLSGAPSVSGSRVSHKLIGGVVETRYCIKCQATTSLGQKIELSDALWVRAACFAL